MVPLVLESEGRGLVTVRSYLTCVQSVLSIPVDGYNCSTDTLPRGPVFNLFIRSPTGDTLSS